MKYENNFLENFQKALETNDKEGLHALFVGRIANLISYDKKELVDALIGSGADIKPSINDKKLSKFIIDGVENGNQTVIKTVSGLIIKKQYGFTMNDAASDRAAPAGKQTTTRKGVDWDKIGKVVDTVGKGLQGVMGFAKDVQTLKGGKTSQQMIDDQVSLNQSTKGGNSGGGSSSVGKKLLIGGGIVVGIVIVGFGIKWLVSRNAGAAAGAAAPAAAPAASTGGTPGTVK